VLAADPTWIRSSILRYYDHLDVLIVSASDNGRGWTGAPVRSEECVTAVLELDHRGIVEVVRGTWIDAVEPMRADTAQRQAAVDAIGERADWILQLDTDELLPDLDQVVAAIHHAEALGVDAVEWPMRVLFRRLRGGRYLEVVSRNGDRRFEYPGAIAVRSGIRLRDARRPGGPYLRPTVSGDVQSLQVARPPEPGEHRSWVLPASAAVLHNSWARSPRDVRSKVRSWGHGGTWRASAYFWLIWWPAPLTWRWLRSFHPFARRLWPRLGISPPLPAAIDPRDLDGQGVRRTASRS
jgi:hypothetical protein